MEKCTILVLLSVLAALVAISKAAEENAGKCFVCSYWKDHKEETDEDCCDLDEDGNNDHEQVFIHTCQTGAHCVTEFYKDEKGDVAYISRTCRTSCQNATDSVAVTGYPWMASRLCCNSYGLCNHYDLDDSRKHLTNA